MDANAEVLYHCGLMIQTGPFAVRVSSLAPTSFSLFSAHLHAHVLSRIDTVHIFVNCCPVWKRSIRKILSQFITLPVATELSICTYRNPHSNCRWVIEM
jgi:hypothetical protein